MNVVVLLSRVLAKSIRFIDTFCYWMEDVIRDTLTIAANLLTFALTLALTLPLQILIVPLDLCYGLCEIVYRRRKK